VHRGLSRSGVYGRLAEQVALLTFARFLAFVRNVTAAVGMNVAI